MSSTAQVNGPPGPQRYIDGVDPEHPDYIKNLQRPAEVKEDIHQMENRSRVKVVLNSECFKEELEDIVDEQLRHGPYPASLLALQQINELLMPASRGGLNSLARASTVIPINDLKGTDSTGFVKGEKLLRCKVAALYRLVDLHGWSEGIYNHISARVSSDEEHFLLNPFGMNYSEVTAASLLKVDVTGEIVNHGTSHFGVSKAGFTLHSAIHQARPDIKCVIHLHTPVGIAISSMKHGLLPLCQEAIFCGKISYHDYHGVLVDDEEKEKIARDLGVHNKVLILRNHGLVACGETVEEAFFYANNLMIACAAQIRAIPVGLDNLHLPSEEVIKNAHKVGTQGGGGTETQGKKWRCGEMEFEALMRQLDNSGYRTGYMYKVPMIKQDKKDRSNSEVEIPPSSSSFTYVFDEDYENSKYVSPLKMAQDRQKKAFKAGWLTSPNAYKKTELEEIGTTTPKKITRWVSEEESPNKPGCVQVKVEHPNQFAPQGENPKELKQKQKSIRKDYYEERVTAGPQSKILEGLSWDEAQKAKDGQLSGAGDQVIVVGAASKGIIQRDHQHNAVVYRQYYAANPFENMSEAEIGTYQEEVQNKESSEPAESTEPQNEVEEDSNKRQEAQDTEGLVNVQREFYDIPKVTDNSGGFDEKGQDEVLARLANTVVQTVMHEALAVARRLGGKGQQILMGSTTDTSAQQRCTESLYAVGGQIENNIRKRGDKNKLREDKSNSSNFRDSNKQKSNTKQSPHSKPAQHGVCGENEAGFPKQKLFTSSHAPGTSIHIDEKASRGDTFSLQINPITVQHSCQADGMKIKFSIHSTVRRRICAEIDHECPVEEIIATATQPTVNLLYSQQGPNVNMTPKVNVITGNEKLRNGSFDKELNSEASTVSTSDHVIKCVTTEKEYKNERNIEKGRIEKVNSAQDGGTKPNTNGKDKLTIPIIEERNKRIENEISAEDNIKLSENFDANEASRIRSEVTAIEKEKSEPHAKPPQLFSRYKKQNKFSKHGKKSNPNKNLAPLSPVREIAYEGTQQEMDEMGEVLEKMDDSFERLLLTAEDELLLCDKSGDIYLDLSEFKGIAPLAGDGSILSSQTRLPGSEKQKPQYSENEIDFDVHSKKTFVDKTISQRNDGVISQSTNGTRLNNIPQKLAATNVDDISQRKTETDVTDIILQKKTETKINGIIPQKKTETNVDDIIPQKKTETNVDDIFPQKKTETNVDDIIPQKKTETNVDDIIPQKKTETNVDDIIPQKKTETNVDDIIPQKKTETNVDDIIPQKKTETNVDDIIPQKKTETNVDDIIPQKKTETNVDDIIPQKKTETNVDDIIPQKKTETNVDDIIPQKKTETNVEDIIPQNKTETNVDDIIPQKKTETNVDDIIPQKKTETNVDDIIPQKKTETTLDDVISQKKTETNVDDIIPQKKTETNVDDIIPQKKTETNVDDIIPQKKTETNVDDIIPQKKTETNVDDIIPQNKTETNVDDIIPQNKTETNVDDIIPQKKTKTNVDEIIHQNDCNVSNIHFYSSQKMTATDVDDTILQKKTETNVAEKSSRNTETSFDHHISYHDIETDIDAVIPCHQSERNTQNVLHSRVETNVDDIISYEDTEKALEDLDNKYVSELLDHPSGMKTDNINSLPFEEEIVEQVPCTETESIKFQLDNKRGMKYMLDDSITSEGPIQTSSPKIARVKQKSFHTDILKDLCQLDNTLPDSISNDNSFKLGSKSQPPQVGADLSPKDDSFLTRSSSLDDDNMKESQHSSLLKDNQFENERQPCSPIYHSSRSILNEYHLKKHNELMELSSAKSFLTSPNLQFQGSASDILPPLPDTEDVPSISDIEDSDLPTSVAIHSKKYRPSHKEIQLDAPSHVDHQAAERTPKSRWIPKSKRVKPVPHKPISSKVDHVGTLMGCDSPSTKSTTGQVNELKMKEPNISLDESKEGCSNEMCEAGKWKKTSKNDRYDGEKDEERRPRSKRDRYADGEKDEGRRPRIKKDRYDDDFDRDKEKRPRSKRDRYDDDGETDKERRPISKIYDDDKGEERRSRSKKDRYDDDNDDKYMKRRPRSKKDRYDDDGEKDEIRSRSKRDRYDDGGKKDERRRPRIEKDRYDNDGDSEKRERSLRSKMERYVGDEKDTEKRERSRKDGYEDNVYDKNKERSQSKRDRYGDDDNGNHRENSKREKTRDEKSELFDYECESDQDGIYHIDKSKKCEKTRRGKESLDLEHDEKRDNRSQDRSHSKKNKGLLTETRKQDDVRTRKIGRVSDEPLIPDIEEKKSLKIKPEWGKSAPNLIGYQTNIPSGKGLSLPIESFDPGASPRLSRRRGGAIAPGKEKLKQMNNPYKNKRNHLFVPLGPGNNLNLSLHSVHKSNASLASSTLSRRSKSSSRIFENCPELLPPVPQLNPLTGEPYNFYHPLMSKSMESLGSRASSMRLYYPPEVDRTSESCDWNPLQERTIYEPPTKANERNNDSLQNDSNDYNVHEPVDWREESYEETQKKEDEERNEKVRDYYDVEKRVNEKYKDYGDDEDKKGNNEGSFSEIDQAKMKERRYWYSETEKPCKKESIPKAENMPSTPQKSPKSASKGENAADHVEKQTASVGETVPKALFENPPESKADSEKDYETPELLPKKGLLGRLGKSLTIGKKKNEEKSKAPLEKRATVDESSNQKEYFAAEKKRMKKLAKGKEEPTAGLYFHDGDVKMDPAVIKYEIRANDEIKPRTDSATCKPFSTFASPSKNTEGYDDYFEKENGAKRRQSLPNANQRESVEPPKLSLKYSNVDDDSQDDDIRVDKDMPKNKENSEEEERSNERKWHPRTRRDKVSPLRPRTSKSPENPSPHPFRRDSVDHRDPVLSETFNTTFESDVGIVNSSAPVYLNQGISYPLRVPDIPGNHLDPSASFDTSELIHYKKHTRRESIDMDSSFPASPRCGEKSPVRRRISQVSLGGMDPGLSRTRSSSTSSSPLIYQPWRSQRKQRGRSMSISEMVYAAGAPRPSRSHSVGEITYNDSLLGYATGRRRSRTNSIGEIATGRRRSRTNSIGEIAITSRMYHRRRSRSHSRASLGDTSFGSVAPSSQRRQSGTWSSHPAELDVVPANTAPVKRSESAREPSKNSQLIDELGRKNLERTKSDRQPQIKEELGEDKPVSPSKSDTMKSTDSASGGETLEERSSKEGSPTKEHPTTKDKKGKKKKFRIPSFSKKKNKETKESAI